MLEQLSGIGAAGTMGQFRISTKEFTIKKSTFHVYTLQVQ